MATRRIAPITTVLPIPPQNYDSSYMVNLVSALQRAMHGLEQAPTLRGGWLNLSDPRFDAYNLTVGDIYIDGNILKIVRMGDTGFLGGGLTIATGTVTVTT